MATVALSTYYRKYCPSRVHNCLHPVYWRLRAGWSGDGYPGQRMHVALLSACGWRFPVPCETPCFVQRFKHARTLCVHVLQFYLVFNSGFFILRVREVT